MQYFLTGICLLLILWYFPKWSFIKESGLTVKESRLLIAFKIFAGLIIAGYFNYVFENISPHVDYIGYNEEGLVQYRLLLNNPSLFFNDFFSAFKEYGPGGLLASKESFWTFLRFNLLYKLVGLLNIITQGNFYLNTMLFSSFVVIGSFAFFRLYFSIYKKSKWAIIFACFCLPSLLLYTACIHKDGIVFVCIAIISYNIHQFFSNHAGIKLKQVSATFMALLFIFFLRNYLIMALLPAMLLSVLAVVLPIRRRYTVVVCYIVFISLFFVSGLYDSPVNLPAAVVQRKTDFAALQEGTTSIPMQPLEPSFLSFLQSLPQALNHYFLRPYLWEFRQVSVVLTALEILLYQLIIIFFLVYKKKNNQPLHPFNLFGLALVLHMALVVGYTIPNIGAIVRYRCIFWPLLLCPVLCNIEWERLRFFGRLKG